MLRIVFELDGVIEFDHNLKSSPVISTGLKTGASTETLGTSYTIDEGEEHIFMIDGDVSERHLVKIDNPETYTGAHGAYVPTGDERISITTQLDGSTPQRLISTGWTDCIATWVPIQFIQSSVEDKNVLQVCIGEQY